MAGRKDPDPRPLSSACQNPVSLGLWLPRKPGDGDAGVPGRETQNLRVRPGVSVSFQVLTCEVWRLAPFRRRDV